MLKRIYNAIKSDDEKTFTAFMVQENCFSYSFGRFPILSLCYMFKSYKILDKYEKKLLPISKYIVVQEYGEIYLKFKKLAKKSIRFFVAENQSFVYPIYILALTGDNDTINRHYDIIYKNAEINEVLGKIYANLGENHTKIAVNKFVSKQNKHSFFQKLFITIACLVMCLMLAFPIFSLMAAKKISGLGTNSSPIKISSSAEFVSAIKSGKRNYKITEDIVLSEEVYSDKFSGKIDGNGHTVTLSQNQKTSLFDNLTGEINDLIFEVNLNDILLKNNFAIIAKNFSGKISGCEINGEINAKFECSDDTYLSIFVIENNGEIKNSLSSVSVSATNDSEKNAFLSVFAGKNNGTISYSETTKGELKTDTVDVAGIVAENNGKIISCTNRLTISQTSSKLWHPNSAGIALNNNGEILNSKNYGNVSSESLNEESTSEENKNGFAVYVAGIACNSINKIEGSRNYGDIFAKSKTATIYAGGIVAMNAISDKSMGTINLCKAVCTITAENDDEREMFVGGLCGISNTNILSSGYEGDLKINSGGRAEVGGLVGAHYQGVFNNSLTKVANCYSAATLSSDSSGSEIYFGLVVGTCTTGDGMNLSYLLVNDFYVSNGASQFYHIVQYSESDQSHPEAITNLNGLKSYSSLEELKNNYKGDILND